MKCLRNFSKLPPYCNFKTFPSAVPDAALRASCNRGWFCEKWNASQASLEEVSLPRSTQSIQAGVPSKEWKEQLAKLEKSQAIERLWKKKYRLAER